MAKFRFPGKALKLNNRKRVKFRTGEEGNFDEHRVLQIKSGLLLFNQLFGESDEDDDDEFIGFENPYDKSVFKKKKKVKLISYENKLESSCDSPINSYIENNNDSEDEREDTCLSIAINGLLENAPKHEAVILENNQFCDFDKKDLNSVKLLSEKVKESKKLVKDISERTSKKFVLPSFSARSSRIIKPNKRLFSDFALFSSSNQKEEEAKLAAGNDNGEHHKVTNRVKQIIEQDSDDDDDVKENDPVCRSITFYTDSITEEFKGQVGRPPKKLLKKGESQSQEEQNALNISISPAKGPKEDKVKEKIEKLLRSPWDNRIKQNVKITEKEKDSSSGCILNNTKINKLILRKARLNLNKQTLQKIRNPASVQHLVPLSEDEAAENKCGLCQIKSCSTICRYGVSCCDTCSMSINFFIETLSTNLECIGGQGECQLVGLLMEERCLACWLARILATCAMPSLLHDRLRNILSPIVKDRIPTSLGRSCSAVSSASNDAGDGKGDCSVRNFGSLVDLPGGWKRKNGRYVVVISPSGEKFRSILKLEEHLKRQGINAQASVLFGNLNPKSSMNLDTNVIGSRQNVKLLNKGNNVVVTTLPGGWTRRIKWKNTGDSFDTYVCSPDGRTFRSRKELSSYFQHIGKVDDIFKYFPVKTSNASCANSSENSEASSTEPVSSEGSTDEESAHLSDSEEEDTVSGVNHLLRNEMSKQDKVFNQLNKPHEVSANDNSLNHLGDYENNLTEETNKLEKKSEKLIISNLQSHLLGTSMDNSNSVQKNISEQVEKLTSIELNNFSSIEETTLSSSTDDTESDVESSGINLNLFSKVKKDSNYLSNVQETEICESDNVILKIRNAVPVSAQSGESGKESSRSKHKKKKKRKHEKHIKEKRKDNDKKYPLICDVDKIKTKVTVDTNNVVPVDSKPKSSLLPSLGINSSLFNEVNSCASIPYHPNDTWQTLINYSIPVSARTNQDTVSENSTKNELPGKMVDDLGNVDSSCNDKNSTEHLNKRPTLTGFTKENFGSGWGRKIKWNEKGQGKVAFLTSPEGQRIVSSIELMAYFKKAGKTMLNIDYYFPKDLVRTFPEEKECVAEVLNEDVLQRLSPTSFVEKKLKRNVVYRQSQHVYNNNASKSLKGPQKLKSNVLNKEINKRKGKRSSSSNGNEPSLGTDIGPRVKHVCRSKAQVLGMPRAVFPSPEYKQHQQTIPSQVVNDCVKRKINSRRKATKFMSVLTPKGKRVLKKTVWCNKCSGCTTPNCMTCGNCLDMKKYGGPGTKKKPCIMRKCHNPLRAIKRVSQIDAAVEGQEDEIEKEVQEMDENLVSQAVNFSTPANSELEVTSDILLENDIKERKSEFEEEIFSSVERPIFVPKLMKPANEPKDKGDIQMGKECIPGMRVNIDYWQEYDAEEMLMSGFPIITSVPLEMDSFCFRCGSAGVEELLYCIWCCEGVHPFCLEEGEGPENDEEESLWVCRKCCVCHICGGSGHYDLHQCSGCKKHYHLECLGPTSHLSCQPSQEGIWVSDALHLLPFSWPMQTPLMRISDSCAVESKEESITLLEELENLQSIFDINECPLKEETCLLPSAMSRNPSVFSPDKKKNILVESVCIEDTFADLAEGDHICLEDAFEEFDEFIPPLPTVPLPKDEEVINFFRDIDLYETKRCKQDKYFAKMEDDEYLCLKYKKILPFDQSPVETSLKKIVHAINLEYFECFGYCVLPDLKIEKQDTEIFASVLSDPDVGMSIDLKTAILIRRAEVQQAMKDLEEKRIQEEKRMKEIEREKSRRKKLESKEWNDKENYKLNKKKLKYRRSSQASSRDAEESFVEYKNSSSGHWQPNSWEEFDALFKFTNKSNGNEETSSSRCNEKSALKTPPKDERKRKRGRPRESLTPGQRKAKKLKLSQCSVKVTRLELKKFNTRRRSLSPKKSPFKKLKKSGNNSPLKKNIFKIKNSSVRKALIKDDRNREASTSNRASKDSNYDAEFGMNSPETLRQMADRVVCNISSSASDEKDLLESESLMTVRDDQIDLNIRLAAAEENLSAEIETIIEINEETRTSINLASIPDDESTTVHYNNKSIAANFVSPENVSFSIKEDKDRPSTRPRRLAFGRASELASLRKAMMDM